MNAKKPARSKRPIWRRAWLWLALLLTLGAGAGGWYVWGKTSQAQTASTTQTTAARTTAATQGNLTVSVSGSGTLQAGKTVDLSFSSRGTLAEVNVQVGDTVKAGQVLARMSDSVDLQANLASAELALLQAQNSLTSLQKNAATNLAQAYQTLLAAQKSYASALSSEQRTGGARCSKEVVAKYKEIYESAVKKLDDLTTRDYGSDAWLIARYDYDTASANYAYCASYTADEKASAVSSLTVAEAALKTAESAYQTLKTGSGIDPDALKLAEMKVTAAETKLAQAKEDLAGLTLSAPIDGKVVYLAASAGAIADTSKFITIASTSSMALQVSVDETDMDKLSVGSTAEVVFDALPEDVFTGKVTQVDPALTTSGQYRVTKGVVTLDADSVKALQGYPLGMNATVTVISQQALGVVIVPVTALKDLGDGQYAVMLKASDGTLKLQTVTVGLQTDESAEIQSGLKVGDEVSTGTVSASSGSSSSSASTKQDSGAMMAPPDGAAPPMP